MGQSARTKLEEIEKRGAIPKQMHKLQIMKRNQRMRCRYLFERHKPIHQSLQNDIRRYKGMTRHLSSRTKQRVRQLTWPGAGRKKTKLLQRLSDPDSHFQDMTSSKCINLINAMYCDFVGWVAGTAVPEVRSYVYHNHMKRGTSMFTGCQ